MVNCILEIFVHVLHTLCYWCCCYCSFQTPELSTLESPMSFLPIMNGTEVIGFGATGICLQKGTMRLSLCTNTGRWFAHPSLEITMPRSSGGIQRNTYSASHRYYSLRWHFLFVAEFSLWLFHVLHSMPSRFPSRTVILHFYPVCVVSLFTTCQHV